MKDRELLRGLGTDETVILKLILKELCTKQCTGICWYRTGSSGSLLWIQYKLNVYWTVHHCNSWRMKDQLDATCYFISLLMCSTCFGHKNWNKIASGIKLVFHSSAVKTLHTMRGNSITGRQTTDLFRATLLSGVCCNVRCDEWNVSTQFFERCKEWQRNICAIVCKCVCVCVFCFM